jgi:hypothetical protein
LMVCYRPALLARLVINSHSPEAFHDFLHLEWKIGFCG